MVSRNVWKCHRWRLKKKKWFCNECKDKSSNVKCVCVWMIILLIKKNKQFYNIILYFCMIVDRQLIIVL